VAKVHHQHIYEYKLKICVSKIKIQFRSKPNPAPALVLTRFLGVWDLLDVFAVGPLPGSVWVAVSSLGSHCFLEWLVACKKWFNLRLFII
jgi:hypothetical protein